MITRINQQLKDEKKSAFADFFSNGFYFLGQNNLLSKSG